MTEHVFEHLTYSESQSALASIYKTIVKGGRLRVAVPHGCHPHPDKIRHVGINGLGEDAVDHKQFLNLDILRELMESIGFKCQHLEGYDSRGRLAENESSFQDGFIRRSRKKHFHNDWMFSDTNTSLIMDGIKL